MKNLEKLKMHINYVATNLYALIFCKIINNLFFFFYIYKNYSFIFVCVSSISLFGIEFDLLNGASNSMAVRYSRAIGGH